MKRAAFGTVLLTLVVAGAWAQAAPVALVGARVVPVSGPPIERGTVLIEGGRIQAVGASVTIPAEARRIDLTGKVLIPGLVDAHSSLFLAPEDLAGAGAADRDVLDAVDFFDRDADRVLARGVTTLYLSPGNRGSVNGVGAIVKLEGSAAGPRARPLRPSAALKLSLGVSVNNRSSSLDRLAGYEALRTAFRGAEQYAKSLERYERELRAYEKEQQQTPAAAPAQAPEAAPPNRTGDETPARPMARPTRPRRSPAQEVLLAALKGTLPVRIEAHRVEDILNALRLGDEFKLKLVLERATEAPAVAREIARRRVPVVWGPTLPEGPPRLETRRHSPGSAAALARAGVLIALTTDGERGLASRFLLENAAAAAGWGLPPDEALRAVTLNAARILGVAERVGSIEAGKDADLVVLSAAPWDPAARVEKVFVNGRIVFDTAQADARR